MSTHSKKSLSSRDYKRIESSEDERRGWLSSRCLAVRLASEQDPEYFYERDPNITLVRTPRGNWNMSNLFPANDAKSQWIRVIIYKTKSHCDSGAAILREDRNLEVLFTNPQCFETRGSVQGKVLRLSNIDPSVANTELSRFCPDTQRIQRREDFEALFVFEDTYKARGAFEKLKEMFLYDVPILVTFERVGSQQDEDEVVCLSSNRELASSLPLKRKIEDDHVVKREEFKQENSATKNQKILTVPDGRIIEIDKKEGDAAEVKPDKISTSRSPEEKEKVPAEIGNGESDETPEPVALGSYFGSRFTSPSIISSAAINSPPIRLPSIAQWAMPPPPISSPSPSTAPSGSSAASLASPPCPSGSHQTPPPLSGAQWSMPPPSNSAKATSTPSPTTAFKFWTVPPPTVSKPASSAATSDPPRELWSRPPPPIASLSNGKRSKPSFPSSISASPLATIDSPPNGQSSKPPSSNPALVSSSSVPRDPRLRAEWSRPPPPITMPSFCPPPSYTSPRAQPSKPPPSVPFSAASIEKIPPRDRFEKRRPASSASSARGASPDRFSYVAEDLIRNAGPSIAHRVVDMLKTCSMTEEKILESVAALTTPATKEAWVKYMLKAIKESSNCEGVEDTTLMQCLNECRRLFARNNEAMKKLLEFVQHEELKADGEKSEHSATRAMEMTLFIKKMKYSCFEIEHIWKNKRSVFTRSLIDRMSQNCEKNSTFSFESVATRIKHYFEVNERR